MVRWRTQGALGVLALLVCLGMVMPADGAKKRNQRNLLPSEVLLEAVKGNDLEQCESMLKKDPNAVKIRDHHGGTLLCLASEKGHYEIVNFLLGVGADIDAADNGRMTALHWACFNGYLPIVMLLSASGAKLDTIDTMRETPLKIAQNRGYGEIKKFLQCMLYWTNYKPEQQSRKYLKALQKSDSKILALLACRYEKQKNAQALKQLKKFVPQDEMWNRALAFTSKEFQEQVLAEQ